MFLKYINKKTMNDIIINKIKILAELSCFLDHSIPESVTKVSSKTKEHQEKVFEELISEGIIHKDAESNSFIFSGVNKEKYTEIYLTSYNNFLK